MSIWLIVLIVIAIFGMNVGTVMLLTRSTKMKLPKLKDYTQPIDLKGQQASDKAEAEHESGNDQQP